MDLILNSDLENVPTSPPLVSPSQSPIDQSEIQACLNEYQYASEPSYFTRPNRYHGPPSTWRSWTANDRIVTESLDVTRAKDLSIHLYNAYDLKKRARSLSHAEHSKGKTRLTSVSGDDQQVAEQEFVPPDVWTAWPLRGQHVPRTSYLHDPSIDVRSRMPRIKPSSTLEDALLATTVRHARKRWEARHNESGHHQARATSQPWKTEHDPGKGKLKNPAITEQQQYQPQVPQSADGNGTSDSEAGSNVVGHATMDENLPQGVQFFSSQAFAMAADSSSENEAPTISSEQDYPVFSADDDTIHALIKPSVRHLLTKLDDLLEGLHKARAAYAIKGDNMNSRSRSRSVFSDTEMTEDDQFVRSGSRAVVKKRGRKRKQSAYLSRPGTSQESISRGRYAAEEPEKKTKKNQSYVLRDWSDVMGMATLTGWDVQTVARASERCARLFGQNMTFRTFHQGSGDPKTASHEQPWFEEEVAYVPTNENSAIIAVEAPSSEARLEVRQTIDCIRTSARCPRCQNLKIRCFAPQSTSAVEFTQPVACAACSSIPDLSPPCSGIMVRPRVKPNNKTCPYPDCTRNNPTKSFTKNYHLQRHLTDVHGHIGSPSTSPMVKNHNFDDQRDVATDEPIRLTAALTCPVVSCPQGTRIFKRSTRLYDHIRKTHPEFDVASFKRIVAKYSERGRYDRSRSRSQSQGQTPTREDDDVTESVDKNDEHEENGVKQPENTQDEILREQSDSQ